MTHHPDLADEQAYLEAGVDGLTFGRLDAEDGDTWYVGRRHVEDASLSLPVDDGAGRPRPDHRARGSVELG